MGGVIGKVAPGYKADLVFLDLANVNFLPLNDAANQIVNCEDSSAVHSVMIGGRMVLEERQFRRLSIMMVCANVWRSPPDGCAK